MFLLLYFLSGAAGLVYEVLWLRLLTLSMGNTVGAVGVLLAAFMGGLAIGAWWAGRIAGGLSAASALRAYAVLEAGVGVVALLLPSVLDLTMPLLARAYANGDGGATFGVVRGLVAMLLLTVPAAAMGATFPLAVRWREADLAREDDDTSDAPSRRAGGLYAANTAGAALGAAAAGFVLLPALGSTGTTFVGVALNAAAAAGAFALASRAPASPALTDAATGTRVRSTSTRVPRSDEPACCIGESEIAPAARLRRAAAAVMLSGAVALVYQITWTRILAMVLGPTTYAFSAVLVSVITGIAIGSAVAASRAPRSSDRAASWLGGVLIAASCAALAASLVVDRLPLVMATLVTGADVTFTSILLAQAAIVVAIQLPMTIALGAVFPLALAVAAPEGERVPRQVSLIYAVNTAGAIAGALGTSFVLMPHLGIQTSVRLAAIAAAAGGVAVAWRSARRSAVMALAGGAAVVLAVVLPSWNHNRLANGGYRYAPTLAAADFETGLDAGQLLYYREGAAGTVSVRQLPGVRSLAIDGKVDASNGADMPTQKLLAHLPLLLHSNPRRVCVIGLGSGVTLAAALTHPIERADVVEISPEVVEASSLFEPENRSPLADRRARLIVGDGRTHLRLSRDLYDVIISEPSNPWMAGIAALFTREFFDAARARLAPGGLLMQWAHTYNITDADLRSIVGTFLSVFPDGLAWLVGESDLLLVGPTGPLPGLEDGIEASWARPGVAADLARGTIRDPFSVLTLHVARGEDLRPYVASALVQTDDRLALEYSAPRAIYGRFQGNNVERLRALARAARQPPAVATARARATAGEWTNRGALQQRADAPGLAYADFRAAAVLSPGDEEALAGLVRAAARSGQLASAEQFLSEIAPAGGAAVLVELSIVRAALGQLESATATARDAVVANPRQGRALEQLASMYAEGGEEEGLQRLAQLADEAGVPAAALYARLHLAFVRQAFDEAAQTGEAYSRLNPGNASAWVLLGSARAALGQLDRAREALEAAQRLEPSDARVLVNLGTLALRQDRLETAVARFSEAVFLSPTLPEAINGLADTLDRQGHTARAVTVRRRLQDP